MATSDDIIDGIDTAFGLVQFLLDQKIIVDETSADLAKRLAAKIDAGGRWDKADRDAFFKSLQDLDDAERPTGVG